MCHHVSSLFSHIQFTCLDYIIESPRLHYQRLAVHPIPPEHTNLLASTIRRVLLSEPQAAGITRVHIKGAVHEYSTLPGIRESVHEILSHLRDVVLQTDTDEVQTGSISFQGPGMLTAGCISLPSSVNIIDNAQHIAQVEAETELKMEVTIEKKGALRGNSDIPLQDATFLVDAAFPPVRRLSYHVYTFEGGSSLQDLLMFEIWTNGSITLEELLCNAASYLSCLFQPFLALKARSKSAVSEDFLFEHQSLRGISIDELTLPPAVATALKKAGVSTVLQLVKHSQEELRQKLAPLRKGSMRLLFTALRQRLNRELRLCHH